MIGGILDGLQKAAPRTPWEKHGFWTDDTADIHPDQWAAIEDDLQVVELSARKNIDPNAAQSYTIRITTCS